MKWFNYAKIRVILIGFVAAIMSGGESAKGDFIWAQKADMPTPRWTQTSAVVNGKIYIIGGYPSEGEPGERALSTMEEYDPTTNTWTRKTDMPTARCDFVGSSAVVNGKIYVISGWDSNPLSIVEEYDPVTDTWTRKADMPTRRWMLATVAFEGKIYAIGGYLSGTWLGLKTVEVYEPATDTWIRKADMPLGVALLNTRVVRGKIYAIGGRPDLKSRAYMQEYDPATDTWTRKANMLVATSQMGSVVFGDKIIVIGGWLWSMNYPYTTVQVYNPDTDRWTMEADTPFLRASFSAEVVNNRIYVIGGTNRRHPCPALSTVFELGPLVDFNCDGIVDAGDVCIMIDHWGENYPLCDIGPTPLGDGIVDVKDLIVLAEHLFEEVVPPTPIFEEVVPPTPTPPTSAGSFTENPDGTYTMTDCGMDIWGLTDQFHYAYKTLTGPGSIVARIDSVTNTHMWAKAGVMIRETLDGGSKHAFVCVTPGNGVAFLSRSDTNGASILEANQRGITSPWWVKLERDAQGNLTAAHSRDGIAWQSVAGAVARNIPMNPDVHIGLALTSHNAAETCQAVFSNVTITGDVAPQWANQDVGPFGQP